MNGVVSILDEIHYARVEALWQEFEARFGVHGVYRTPVPHFSYHVAENYETNNLEQLLREVARRTSPFRIKTNGLGIFTGVDPVLYIPVIRTSALTNLHQQLWQPLSDISDNAQLHYHPDNWRPHITLTHRDVDHDLLPQVVRLLSERLFLWDVVVDNLAVLDNSEEIHTVRFRFPLGK